MKSTLKTLLRIIGIFLLSATVVLLIVFGVYWSKISAIPTVGEKVEPLKTSGVYNVLLLGLDTRDTSNMKDARTDVNMLVTIDSKQNRIMITSFMRDMLVDVPNQGMHKLNSAYFYGGPDYTIQVLKNSFGVDVDRYAVVDFGRSAKIIDLLGGVDVDVKPIEVPKIKPPVQAGLQHLNGAQATSYMRIRKVGNSDYERTQRQRTVLQNVIKNFSGLSFVDISNLLDEIPKFTKTNASAFDMLAMANMAKSIGGKNIEQLRIPADNTFTSGMYYGASVLMPDFELNTQLVKEFLNAKSQKDTSKSN